MTEKGIIVSLRVCSTCKIPRPLSEFYVQMEARRSLKAGRKITHPCRHCQATRDRLSRKPKQDYSDAIKLERGCADCGIRSTHPEIYDFDHRPDEVKVKAVALFLTKGTLDQMKAEIAKCDVVCSNCHRIRTRQRKHGAFGKDRVV